MAYVRTSLRCQDGVAGCGISLIRIRLRKFGIRDVLFFLCGGPIDVLIGNIFIHFWYL